MFSFVRRHARPAGAPQLNSGQRNERAILHSNLAREHAVGPSLHVPRAWLIMVMTGVTAVCVVQFFWVIAVRWGSCSEPLQNSFGEIRSHCAFSLAAMTPPTPTKCSSKLASQSLRFVARSMLRSAVRPLRFFCFHAQ